MSKAHNVTVLTDLHLRSDYIPGFLEKQVDTLLRIVNEKPPHTLVINGDIFEKRNPKGEELLAFQYLLDNFKCGDIIINRGNHDTIRKDGTSETTLSLFSNKARVICDTETVYIGGVNFDFIPHYEDEDRIIKDLKRTKNPVFGHFGFNGCISNGAYSYEAKVKKSHFKNKLTFLGHIHKARQYDNIHIIGTQYSNTFGEANASKSFYRLVLRDGDIQVIKKPINHGVKHVVGGIHELEALNKKYKFSDFFTILRLKLDKLDEYAEAQLTEEVTGKYDINHLEIVFDDVLPKIGSSYIPTGPSFALDDRLIEEYIEAHDTSHTKEELLQTLQVIRNEIK